MTFVYFLMNQPPAATVDPDVFCQVASIYTLAKVPVVDDRVSTAGLILSSQGLNAKKKV
jgi:hypothetical protein